MLVARVDDDRLDAWMRAALEEGRKALPHCKPNPPVGCVLVRAGEIVARGFTQPPGQAHAEAMALAGVEGRATGLTAFVTLEPCSFHGRTPSCAKALVAAGIERVYVAMLDPHERNDGAGIAILREAGVPVVVGLLEQEARADLDAHLRTGASETDDSEAGGPAKRR